jgi:mRNA interferase MazF
VIAAPMTAGSHPTPYRIDVDFNKKPSRILLEQIRTIEKSRLLRPLGSIDPATMTTVLATLRDMFAE